MNTTTVRDSMLARANDVLAYDLLAAVARETGANWNLMLWLMWELVDDGLLDYGTNARVSRSAVLA